MKLVKLMLVAAMVLVAVLVLASCGCEHVYNEAITTAPTCTEEGVKTFTCSECGESYTEAVAATGHTYTDTVVDPTCTEAGYTQHTCACGDTYQNEATEALGHYYTDGIVTPATCAAGGYTTYTCDLCGYLHTADETAADPNAHEYSYILTELTAEQAAANPDAIGVATEGCPICGKVTGTEQQAALVYVNFNGDIALDTYEGSTAYKTALDAGKFTTEEQQKAVAIVDSQKNLDLRGEGHGISLENGAAVITGNRVQFNNTLSLGSDICTIPNYTISFDIIINMIPELKEKEKDYPAFCSTHSDKSYGNNRPIKLCVSGVDVDTNATDDVHTYELYAQSLSGGYVKKNAATGYFLTLGKEYSFRIEFSSSAETGHTYTLKIRAEGETAFTTIGTFEFIPDNKDPYITGLYFDYFKVATGNVIDNLVITTPLAK